MHVKYYQKYATNKQKYEKYEKKILISFFRINLSYKSFQIAIVSRNNLIKKFLLLPMEYGFENKIQIYQTVCFYMYIYIYFYANIIA